MRRHRGAPPPVPRRVTRSQTQVDRISALPDDLLLQVLTRLRCARTAARTAVLAHRWRGLWRSLQEVSFRGLTPDAIHAALARFTRPGCTSLPAIDIHVSRGGTGRRAQVQVDADSVTSLLRAAAGRSPAKLALTVPMLLYYATVDLPRFDVATSIAMDARDVRLALPAEAGLFPALETLSLSGCLVDLAALLPRCPRLRVLSVRVTGKPSRVTTIAVRSAASLQELVVVIASTAFTAIDVVAPALRKLTLAVDRGRFDRLTVVAPMLEEVSWHCFYYSMYVGIGRMWRVASINVRTVEINTTELTDEEEEEEESNQPRRRAHVLSLDILDTRYPSHRDFAEELAKIPVTTFSVLELKIATWSHVLGPLVLNLLRICTGVQRLDMLLVDTRVQATDSCFERCPCQENNWEWRTQTTVSLVDLTEVEIKGLKGDDDEIDFLKMLFRCAPMLQSMTLKLCVGVTIDWYNTFLDTVQEYPNVNSRIWGMVD